MLKIEIMAAEQRFEIKSDNGDYFFFKIVRFSGATIDPEGYDTLGRVEIKTANYSAQGDIFITPFEIVNFYNQLKECYQSLHGHARLTSFEGNISVDISFDGLGRAQVNGTFRADLAEKNELTFEFSSDQSCLAETINSLKFIVNALEG
jgi:hypothetical protein